MEDNGGAERLLVTLVGLLGGQEDRYRWRARGFSDMTVEDLGRAAGLDEDSLFSAVSSLYGRGLLALREYEFCGCGWVFVQPTPAGWAASGAGPLAPPRKSGFSPREERDRPFWFSAAPVGAGQAGDAVQALTIPEGACCILSEKELQPAVPGRKERRRPCSDDSRGTATPAR